MASSSGADDDGDGDPDSTTLEIVVDSPKDGVGGINMAVGSRSYAFSGRDYGDSGPHVGAAWDLNGRTATPRSLYKAQLRARLGLSADDSFPQLSVATSIPTPVPTMSPSSSPPTASLPPTVSPSSPSPTTSSPSVAPTKLSGTVYTASFESDFDSWTTTMFERKSGSTGSGSTGPSSAYDGSYYIYAETSGPNKPAVEFDLCRTFDEDVRRVSFQYHMYGSTIGDVVLQGSDDGGSTYTTLWSKSGNLGDSWYGATVNIGTKGSQDLKFVYVSGSSVTGDFALDAVEVVMGWEPSPLPTPAPTVSQFPTPLPSPQPSSFVATHWVDCDQTPLAFETALARLDASYAGIQRILVAPARTCNLTTAWTITSIDGLEIGCWDTDGGAGERCGRATIGVTAEFANSSSFVDAPLTFKACRNMHVSGIHFDGLGVKHQAAGGGRTVFGNITYTKVKFSRSPATSLNFYFYQGTSTKQAFADLSGDRLALLPSPHAPVTPHTHSHHVRLARIRIASHTPPSQSLTVSSQRWAMLA